ncbi:FAD-binding oxidoreductase [Myxococcota bacterium]|nr:FAD-binding oxidoreductase [Myxococcota bacterium]
MTHEEKLTTLTDQVKTKAKAKVPVTFNKNSVSHFVPNPRDPRYAKEKIDLKAFNQILSIDEEKRICVAESGVTFEDLVAATLPLGLIPKTVPELKTITIGGAVSGCSVESMSFKYGGFHDSCLEYEVVTGTGEVVQCSHTEHADIFHGLHNSFGTLGILTRLTFSLIEAKPYVRMEYVTHSTVDDYWAFLKERIDARDYDFVDGIIYNPGQFITCLGTMVDEAPFVSSYQGDNIFHRSVVEKTMDYLTLPEYFFRYDRDCHWLTNTIPPLTWRPVRKMLGRHFLGSTNLIKWSRRIRHLLKLKKRPEVVVDVFIPGHKFETFYHWYERDFDFFPLWVVPYRYPKVYPFIDDRFAENISDENLIIDFAIYGKKNTHKEVDYSRLLEEKVFELNGVKTLISRNHYSRERFWQIYAKDRYQGLKAKTDPHNLFSDIYTKFHS